MNNKTVRTLPGKRGVIAVAAGVALSFASVAQATIVFSNGGKQTNGFYSVSSTDIGEVPPATFGYSAGATGTFGSLPGTLFDGIVYTTPMPNADGGFIPHTGGAVTNSFNLTNAPRGYDLYSVVSLTADADGDFRLSHSYSLAYSTVSAPNTFIPIISNLFDGTGNNGVAGELKVTVQDNLGAPIAQNAAKLLITFDNNSSFYRELDINGNPAIPEPSTVLLLSAGGLLLWRRRCGRK